MPPPASETFHLRLARPEEHPAVGDLTVAGYDADGYLTLPNGQPDEHYAAWLRKAAERGESSELLVAVDSSGLLGTVTWCPPGSSIRELATSDSQGEFRTLSVAAAARGRGVGRALVTECIERARVLGLTDMVLCSLPEMKPAHRLYESLGFERRTDLDWEPYAGIVLWGFSRQI